MAKQAFGFTFKIRVLCVHVLYLLYVILLWLKLVDLGVQTGHSKNEIHTALIVWIAAFVAIHVVIAISALSKNPHSLLQQTWLNGPMLVFIIFTLFPYGFTLKHMYEAIDVNKPIFTNKNCTLTDNSGHVPMYDFILLQMVMPVMLLTFIIYPLPKRAYTYSEYLAIGMEFINAFDTMDMVGDLAFIRHYGLEWEILFYLSLGVTAVLISFPIKIENEDIVWPLRIAVCSHSEIDLPGATSILHSPIVFETDFAVQKVYTNVNADKSSINEDKPTKSASLPAVNQRSPCTRLNTNLDQSSINDPLSRRVSVEMKKNTLERFQEREQKTYKKMLKVLLTVIFTDISFASLRFKIMVTETSAVHGFNMFIKNVILTCLHFSYLLQHVHSLIVTRLARST